MCNCNKKVNKQLAKSNTCLDQVSLLNFKTGKVRESIKIATRRADRMKPKTKIKTILPSFCPFCGEKTVNR